MAIFWLSGWLILVSSFFFYVVTQWLSVTFRDDSRDTLWQNVTKAPAHHKMKSFAYPPPLVAWVGGHQMPHMTLFCVNNLIILSDTFSLAFSLMYECEWCHHCDWVSQKAKLIPLFASFPFVVKRVQVALCSLLLPGYSWVTPLPSLSLCSLFLALLW